MKAPATLTEANWVVEKTRLPLEQILIAYGIEEKKEELCLSDDLDELWKKLEIIFIGSEAEKMILLKIEEACLKFLLSADTVEELMWLYKKAPKKRDNSPRGIYVRLEILKKIVELTPD